MVGPAKCSLLCILTLGAPCVASSPYLYFSFRVRLMYASVCLCVLVSTPWESRSRVLSADWLLIFSKRLRHPCLSKHWLLISSSLSSKGSISPLASLAPSILTSLVPSIHPHIPRSIHPSSHPSLHPSILTSLALIHLFIHPFLELAANSSVAKAYVRAFENENDGPGSFL